MNDIQGAVLAIDPGFYGAVALYDKASGDLEITDIPLVVKGKKHRLDLEKFCKILDVNSAFASICVVEQVASMPRQGVASAHAFGYCCGAIDMAAVASGVELVKVPAAKWKVGAGIVRGVEDNRRERKAASVRRALEVFPAHAHYFARARDDGRAEAALMAWWYALTLPETAAIAA